MNSSPMKIGHGQFNEEPRNSMTFRIGHRYYDTASSIDAQKMCINIVLTDVTLVVVVIFP